MPVYDAAVSKLSLEGEIFLNIILPLEINSEGRDEENP